MPDIRVQHETDADRYVILQDEVAVGLTQYVERGKHRVFVHTEVAAGAEGLGLATRLVHDALEATRQEGLRVVALCPFVARYVKTHHDFDDIVDAGPWTT